MVLAGDAQLLDADHRAGRPPMGVEARAGRANALVVAHVLNVDRDLGDIGNPHAGRVAHPFQVLVGGAPLQDGVADMENAPARVDRAGIYARVPGQVAGLDRVAVVQAEVRATLGHDLAPRRAAVARLVGHALDLDQHAGQGQRLGADIGHRRPGRPAEPAKDRVHLGLVAHIVEQHEPIGDVVERHVGRFQHQVDVAERLGGLRLDIAESDQIEVDIEGTRTRHEQVVAAGDRVGVVADGLAQIASESNLPPGRAHRASPSIEPRQGAAEGAATPAHSHSVAAAIAQHAPGSGGPAGAALSRRSASRAGRRRRRRWPAIRRPRAARRARRRPCETTRW